MILNVLEVNSWEKLRGSHIRVKTDSISNGKIIAIGHFLKDRWVYPEDFKNLK